jgi:hypothetical protein
METHHSTSKFLAIHDAIELNLMAISVLTTIVSGSRQKVGRRQRKRDFLLDSGESWSSDRGTGRSLRV